MAWVSLGGLVCLESGLLAVFVADAIRPGMFIALHLGACTAIVMLGLGRFWMLPAGDARSSVLAVVLQTAAWTAVAGPFGAVLAAALAVPQKHSADSADAAGPAAPELEPTRLELLHTAILDRRLRLDQAHPIRSMLDVVLDGTQLEKLEALSLISRRYVPGLAPALKRALEDKDASVRVLAATVIAQQNNAYTRGIGSLQKMTTANPERADHWRALGQARLDYAVCGLLEAGRAEAETSQARTDLSRASEIDGSATVPRDDDHAFDPRPTWPHHKLPVASHGP